MCLITLFNWLVIRTMECDGGRNIFTVVLHLHLSETSDLI